MELLAAVSFAGFVLFLLLAFLSGGSDVRARLEALQRPRTETHQEGPPPLKERLVQPLIDGVVVWLQRVLPASLLRDLEQRLEQAGNPVTVSGFLTLQLILTGTLALVPLLLAVAAGLALSPLVFVLVLVFGGVGFFLPQVWLRQRVEQRRGQIIKSLPDAFDLITTCVEAGLGLDAALARVAEKIEGPFAEELRRTLREISLGKMRREALRELGERTGVPDIITFVNAVIQAEQMGSSIGTVLRVQSEQLRVRRRQRAEEMAYKAPVKMLFPLVLCIFPTLFIVILGPAVITIIQEFPGRG
jgi:tight adherence protein C